MTAMEKIYVWQCKTRWTTWWELQNLSFSEKDLQVLIENLNDRGYVNLDIVKRKELGKYWETHSVTINTWKPMNKEKPYPEEKLPEFPF